MDMDELPAKEFPKGPVIIGLVVIILIAVTCWVIKEKKQDAEKQVALQSLDQELTTDEAAVKAERQKVEEMTRSLEDLRAQIQNGQKKASKEIIDQFNKAAAEQRAEREKFVQMADQYNQKVAKYQELEK
jgi:FtsZ-interacting cell division protein ZipA